MHTLHALTQLKNLLVEVFYLYMYSSYVYLSSMAIHMLTKSSTCKWAFKGVPEITIDFAERHRLDRTFQATTLAGLGLLNRQYELEDNAASHESESAGTQPWERFQLHVKRLNDLDPGRTVYKMLYITRHGLGYHNVFEAQVGREEWNVSLSPLDGIRSNVYRPTGHTLMETVESYGPTLDWTRKASSKCKSWETSGQTLWRTNTSLCQERFTRVH